MDKGGEGRTQCVRENTGVLSNDGKNQRSPGDGSDERLRAAGAHSHLSPGPPFTGDAFLFPEHVRPAALRQDLASFLPRGHRPLPGQKLVSTCAVRIPPAPTEPGPLGGQTADKYIPIHKKRGSDRMVTPSNHISDWIRGETKFRRKLFCLLFSPKKVS